MQIRRRSPSPAINVSILRYQAALPDAAPKQHFGGNCLAQRSRS